jgi:alpha-amylase/alpha-mannosidase (GH57 family)
MHDKYICIHGHFYQPPRENPWLESIELQDSAYPYHDWNERITAECYGPNGVSRILDGSGRIFKIFNNYSRISFNLGPTLLSWLEQKAPSVYRSIFEADKESRMRFSGHGSAIAQVYNHMIMPLANDRDKVTQVVWGLRDFELRFGRRPEGMWLGETAVDTRTLEILAAHGIIYTILAPHQARRFRAIGAETWTDVSNGSIDPTRPYRIALPSGGSISIFFYDGPISRAVAFEHLLDRGEYLVGRLMGAFSEHRTGPQLVHVATDGETYGHHHRFGDMALAYALNQIEGQDMAHMTNYGEFLEKFPPQYEAEIIENTSWSCMHGVERWRSDCGCNTGGLAGWNQQWRKPLRDSFDWLRDRLISIYEEHGGALLKNIWAARDEYIDLIFDRSQEDVDEFMERHGIRPMDDLEKQRALKLLEMQRQAMFMYTSCGWFFNEVSGIETVQVIQYAARALQLAEQVSGQQLEPEFLSRLESVPSNRAELGNARKVYELYVKPAAMDLRKVGAHFAISALFEENIEEVQTHCYSVDYDEFKTYLAGKARLAIGRVRITSDITKESKSLMFAVLHLGDHNLSAGVGDYTTLENHQAMSAPILEAFRKADFPEVLHYIEHWFAGSIYSLKTLFRDEQRKVVGSVLESTLGDVESVLHQLYERNAPLMRFLADLSAPLPKALQAAAEFTLNMSLRHVLEADEINEDKLSALLLEAKDARVTLDTAGLVYVIQKNIARACERLWADPEDLSLLGALETLIRLVRTLPFETDLWNAQNHVCELLQRVYPEMKRRSDNGDETVHDWLAMFTNLGELLRVRVA